jgi:hypothetical protein
MRPAHAGKSSSNLHVRGHASSNRRQGAALAVQTAFTNQAGPVMKLRQNRAALLGSRPREQKMCKNCRLDAPARLTRSGRF